MHLTTLLFSYFLVTIFLTTAASQSTEEKDVEVLRAVRGREARLLCGERNLYLDGPKAFVLWLKNYRDFVYRFPRRNVDYRSHIRTSCEAGLCLEDSSLLIKKISARDAGIYTCYIHYQGSPMKNISMELKIVEPTGFPQLYSGTGEILYKGFVGPLSLQSDLTLICVVEDKHSESNVTWRRDGAVIDQQITSRDGLFRVAEIHLHNLTRAEVNAKLECVAQNSEVTEPLVARLRLKMYAPPLSVEIRMNNNTDFEAGQTRVIDCVVVGCEPPPVINWYLGSTPIHPTVHTELHDGNYTVSTMRLTPSLRDHRSKLVCRASNNNYEIPTKAYDAIVTINVGYRPICGMTRELRVGAVVGEEEAVTCTVDSSPEPLEFIWTFTDSKTISTSFSKTEGFQNRYHSRLDWIARGIDMGTLTCRATNKFGEMAKPCTFNISAGGPPALPDCDVTRVYPRSLEVHCHKGWDGGRPQMLHLDIVEQDGVRVQNVTDVGGTFFVNDYDYKKNRTALLYATNSRGKSRDRVIRLAQMSEADNHIKASWMLYVGAAAIAITMTIFFFSCCLAVKLMLCRKQTADLNPEIVPRSAGNFHREPDFTRDEQILGLPRSTCITVNTLTGCRNQYSSSPNPACRRLLVEPRTHSSPEHAYYV